MVILFKCNLCGNEIKKLFKDKDSVPPFLACSCSGVMEKQLPDFAVASYETIDNGNMVKRVELRKDAQVNGKAKGDNYIKTMNDRDTVIKKEEH